MCEGHGEKADAGFVDAQGSILTGRIFVAFRAKLWYDETKKGDPMNDIVTLGNDAGFSVFSFGNHVIRFKAPYSLERHTSVKEWDNGYLVVMAKYRHNLQPEEEYIDLLPILNGLYINGQEFFETNQSSCDSPWLSSPHCVFNQKSSMIPKMKGNYGGFFL